VIKRKFFIIKQSRLVDHSKPDKNTYPVFIMVIRIPDHSKTRQIFPVFGCSLNIGPFHNRTQIKHLNTGLVRYSDHDCTQRELFLKKIFIFIFVNWRGNSLTLIKQLGSHNKNEFFL
jgi:hypothetical protein